MKKIFALSGLLFLLLLSNMTAMTTAAENSQPAAALTESVIKNNDVVVFSEKNKFGIKDKQGNVLVKPDYKKIIRVGDTGWIIQKGSRFGLMDSTGSYLVEPKYRHVERVFGKFVKLGNDNDYGLYDETGKAVIPAQYSSIEPLFGQIFLTCKNYKYGVIDSNGKEILANDFEDIYMPDRKTLRIKFDGEWYQIEQLTPEDIKLPEGTDKITINDTELKITRLVTNTGVVSGYSALTVTDYMLKLISSISPAYEQTIDDLMFSQGAEGVSVFIKLSWLPRFPFTYAKKYYETYRNPNNGPLSEIRNDLKRQIK